MLNLIQASDIEARALLARVTISDILAKSGVSRGTFYRWRRGDGDMRALTKARLLDAIEKLKKEEV